MTTQTTYTEKHAAGYAGQISAEIPSVILSRAAEVAIGFGKVLIKGTADKQVKLPTANGDTGYVGMSVRDPTARMVSTAPTTDQYAIKDEVNMMIKGEMFVVAGANSAAGNPVFYLESDGSLTDVAATHYTQIPRAVWVDTVLSGAIGRIRID